MIQSKPKFSMQHFSLYAFGAIASVVLVFAAVQTFGQTKSPKSNSKSHGHDHENMRFEYMQSIMRPRLVKENDFCVEHKSDEAMMTCDRLVKECTKASSEAEQSKEQPTEQASSSQGPMVPDSSTSKRWSVKQLKHRYEVYLQWCADRKKECEATIKAKKSYTLLLTTLKVTLPSKAEHALEFSLKKARQELKEVNDGYAAFKMIQKKFLLDCERGDFDQAILDAQICQAKIRAEFSNAIKVLDERSVNLPNDELASH